MRSRFGLKKGWWSKQRRGGRLMHGSLFENGDHDGHRESMLHLGKTYERTTPALRYHNRDRRRLRQQSPVISLPHSLPTRHHPLSHRKAGHLCVSPSSSALTVPRLPLHLRHSPLPISVAHEGTWLNQAAPLGRYIYISLFRHSQIRIHSHLRHSRAPTMRRLYLL